MNTNHIKSSQVLVIGGAGYFGSLLIEELIRYTNCHILVGGRNKDSLKKLCCNSSSPDRLTPYVMDLHDPYSCSDALASSDVAICAAGPFQQFSTGLVKLCIDRNVHYIDLADDRTFVMNILALVEQQDKSLVLPAICTGWSTVPALSGILTAIAANGMESVDSIFIQMAPGNRSPRSIGTVYSLLASVGQPFTIWQSGQWRNVSGWSQPRQFHFPEPIGNRIGYLINVPDLQIFPQLFNAARVEFRVSPELGVFNQLLSLLALAARVKLLDNCAKYAPILQQAASLFGFYGHDWGGVGVEVIGKQQGIYLGRRVSLVANRTGQYIPVMPATIMVSRLLSPKANFHGLVPIHNWLTKEQLMSECDQRGYQLIIQETAIE